MLVIIDLVAIAKLPGDTYVTSECLRGIQIRPVPENDEVRLVHYV